MPSQGVRVWLRARGLGWGARTGQESENSTPGRSGLRQTNQPTVSFQGLCEVPGGEIPQTGAPSGNEARTQGLCPGTSVQGGLTEPQPQLPCFPTRCGDLRAVHLESLSKPQRMYNHRASPLSSSAFPFLKIKRPVTAFPGQVLGTGTQT